MERWASSGVRASAWRTEEQARMPRRASPESGAWRSAVRRKSGMSWATLWAWVLANPAAYLQSLPGMQATTASVMPCSPALWRLSAMKSPMQMKEMEGYSGRRVFASAAVRPPVQNTAFLKPESRVERTQMRMVAM